MAKPQPNNSSRNSSIRKSASARPPQTRTAIPTNGSQQDDSEDDEVDDLHAFLSDPPAVADHVLVVAASPSGDAIVQDRTATECKRNPDAIAAATTIACEHWAHSERRIVRFRAVWMRGEKVLATHAWECGESSGDKQQLDGSVSSFLQQQQLFAQAQHKLHLEGFEMVQEGWQKLLTLQNKRIEALERDNQELRDKLRKLDDVSSEIASEQIRAEIASRSRTVDLLESRVLPIVQAVAAKHLQAQNSAPAPAAVPSNSHQEHSHKE